MKDLDLRLHRLAAAQLWLVTREQAIELGLTPRQISLRLQSGALNRVHKGVYVMPGAAGGHEQQVLAACLSAGGIASHRTAAGLWQLRGFQPGPVEITVVNPRPPRLAGVVCHSTDRLDRKDCTRLGVIPVTRPARTLLDVGGVAPDLVAGALEDVLHRGFESTESLRRLLDRVGANGRRGTAALRRALDGRHRTEVPTESALEDAFDRLVRRHHVRQLVRQHRVTLPNGRELRLDFADPEVKLDIEVDGRRWHSAPADADRDRRRDRMLAALGWTVLRYSWDDVRRRGPEVVEEVTGVRHTLRRRVS